MTMIEQVAQSVSEMTDEELLNRVKELRAARRVNTPIPRGKPKKTEKSKVLDMLEGMSQSELESLLSDLEA